MSDFMENEKLIWRELWDNELGLKEVDPTEILKALKEKKD